MLPDLIEGRGFVLVIFLGISCRILLEYKGICVFFSYRLFSKLAYRLLLGFYFRIECRLACLCSSEISLL